MTFYDFQDKIVKKLASSDLEEQKHGQILADKMLEAKPMNNINEDELKVKVDRTVINKCLKNDNVSDDQMSQGIIYSSNFCLFAR